MLTKLKSFLDAHETVIRTVFRILVLALLIKTYLAADDAGDSAYMAYQQLEYSRR